MATIYPSHLIYIYYTHTQLNNAAKEYTKENFIIKGTTKCLSLSCIFLHKKKKIMRQWNFPGVNSENFRI